MLSCFMTCPQLYRQNLSKQSGYKYIGLASYSTITSLLVCVVSGNASKINSFCLSLIFDICPNGESVNRGWAYQASIWDSTTGRSHSRAPTFGIRGVLSASLSSLDLSTISAIENRPFEGFLFECAERKRGWDNLGRWGQSWQLKAD